MLAVGLIKITIITVLCRNKTVGAMKHDDDDALTERRILTSLKIASSASLVIVKGRPLMNNLFFSSLVAYCQKCI